MGQPIDIAYVEILPDLRQFTRNAERQLARAFSGISRDAENAAEDIEDSFSDAFNAVGRDARVAFANIERQAASVDPTVTIDVDVDQDNLGRGVQGAIRGATSSISREGSRLGASVGNSVAGGISDAFTRGLSGLVSGGGGGLIGTAAIAPILFNIAGVATALAAAIAPAVIALGASLPAAAGVAGAAMGTLTLGFMGFSDALDNIGDVEKFNEALEKLSPSAAAVARTIRDLIPQFREIQQVAQESLFQGFDAEIRQLTAALAGPLRTGFADVGGSFNLLGKEVSGFFSSFEGVRVVQEVFATTGRIIDSFAASIEPLLRGFGDLTLAALPFVELLSNEFAQLLAEIGTNLTEMAENGTLKTFFDEAVVTLKELWQIGSDVVNIIKNIFTAAEPGGASMLERIGALTEKVLEFTESEDGIRLIEQSFLALGLALGVVIGAAELFVTAWLTVTEAFADAHRAVTDFFDGVEAAPAKIEALAPAFLKAGSALIRSFMRGVANVGGLIGNVSGAIAGAVRGALNNVLGGLRSALSNVSRLIPGGINIPFLATGGITTGATLAAVGEAGTEAVLPLSGQRGRKTMEMLAEAAGGGGPAVNFGPGAVVVEFNGAVPTQAEAQRTGEAVGLGIASVLAKRDINTRTRMA